VAQGLRVPAADAQELRVSRARVMSLRIPPTGIRAATSSSMRADREQILDEVMWRTGLSNRSAAGTALDATLEPLGSEARPARDTP